ncbi:hypothetical protein D3C76_1444900 [compost metagenome]
MVFGVADLGPLHAVQQTRNLRAFQLMQIRLFVDSVLLFQPAQHFPDAGRCHGGQLFGKR